MAKQRQEEGATRSFRYISLNFLIIKISLADPDPHQNKNVDPNLHQCQKQDTDPHRRQNSRIAEAQNGARDLRKRGLFVEIS
jgi:hypothetical protein